MGFDFKRHVIKVQGGREYLPVSARLVWFRNDHPDWGIVTTAVEINLTPENNKPAYAIFQAQIFNEDGRLMATGTKMEDARGFGDFLEKAETGSVGRALAMCGYGTQFAPELEEGHRLADSPYPMGGSRNGGGNSGYASRQNAPMNNGGMNRPAPQQERPMPQERPQERPMPQERQERPMQAERAPERPMQQERPQPQERPMERAERPAPPRPAPAARDEFEDAFEDDAPPPRPASVATGAANITPPSRPTPQGKVAPSGVSITRVREPEPEDMPPVDDEDDERDPFLDEDEESAPVAPARNARAASAPVEAAPSNRCSVEGCGNLLSPPQLALSMSKFGRPLCLAHQKEAAPAGGNRRNSRNNADAALL